ncbi:unnamed protein product [Kuraishia capsulata CBS 1993]|uniref:Chitobiosyldiphosphodolichol beta-mannosyltransferase n=1 Tax=Kuraishia capsulata CBS 1993 TaxID=1382522 RepID=W6MNT4_9ASCO|nr:uncharacterized protein KUCA_T00004273001 [Kuraishia capsulata CBS 1993]CDK28291.1 unnamed protein product [Kuraishia capsulata CBS 1993]
MPTITICVLGDLGHSPRMLYHVQSFSKLKYNVYLCGYLDSSLPSFIVQDDHVEIKPLRPVKNSHRLPYLAFIGYKLLYQLYTLTALLFSTMRQSQYIMIQNPPSIPILFIIVVLQKLFFHKCELIIDWHNLNYTILNMKFKNLNHPLVRFLKFYERKLSRFAYLNLTVTENLRKFLTSEFGVDEKKIITLYDKAGIHFSPIENESLKEVIIRSHPQVFVDYRENDKILVTSTSFTEDEDFDLFLAALVKYEKLLQKSEQTLHVVVTGKGPLRDQFLSHLESAKLSKISVKSVWLPISEYPEILAVSDLGVSLHVSSSGLDLPMKVVDLFGCGIPVISLGFETIGELVQDGKNGAIVSTADEMVKEFEQLLTESSPKYKTLKKGALKKSTEKWDAEWDRKLKPLVES